MASLSVGTAGIGGVDMSDTKRRIVVIGGGPGGYVAAIRAAQMGSAVTLIERERIGGTCVNIGCISTKCLLHSAELLEAMRKEGPAVGIKADNLSVDFGQVMNHKNDIAKKMGDSIRSLLASYGIDIVEGAAAFTGPGKLVLKKVDGTTERMKGDAFIIATGSINDVPPIPGLKESPYCLDSTGALALTELPSSMIVIGGGVIGMELACAYAAFGTQVDVVEAAEQVLPMLDSDITDIAVKNMEKIGVRFHVASPVQSIEGNRVCCKRADGTELTLQADKILVATGRKANTADLDLDACGIKHIRGQIIVTDSMETNIFNVYAIGDCVFDKVRLAHTASAMGEVAAETACGHRVYYNETTNPTCVYVAPEAAVVGLTEKDAKAQGIEYLVGTFPIMGNGKAMILNGGEGLVKILTTPKYKKILGMQIIGPRATDLISEGALAIRLEATVDELISTIHSHPTVTEAVREAALDVLNRTIHMPPKK